jgi:hypothetical protein
MSDETAPQPRIKITWLIGTLAVFALFMVIGAYSSRMTWNYLDYDQQRAIKRYDTLAKLQQEEGKLINPVDAQGKPTAEWVDQAKGTVRIPIEEAMVKEVDTLKTQPAAMGTEILGATPPAPAKTTPAAILPSAGAHAGGATNAAPAKPSSPAAKVTPRTHAAGGSNE